MLFNNASHFIASLVYTSWVNAGSPLSVTLAQPSLPEKHFLQQNYPNPFNPNTHLEFGISDLGFVSLKIYDVLGNEVATLINEQLPPCSYEMEWNAADYPSGTYFYRIAVHSHKISSDVFTDSKRMFLIK